MIWKNITAMLFVLLGMGCNLCPTDENLKSVFFENKTIFEKLRLKINEDKAIHHINKKHIVRDSKDGKAFISESNPFSDLLKTINVKIILPGQLNSNGSKFIVYSEGFVFTSGFSKGYIYLDEKPQEVIASLNEVKSGSFASGNCRYRNLEGNWYLFASQD